MPLATVKPHNVHRCVTASCECTVDLLHVSPKLKNPEQMRQLRKCFFIVPGKFITNSYFTSLSNSIYVHVHKACIYVLMENKAKQLDQVYLLIISD